MLAGVFLAINIVVTVFILKQPAFAPYNSNIQTVILGEKTFQLEIADNQAEREKGLSGRPELASNGGMLFTFDRPDKYCFWMKDTLLSLDILWFDKNYRLIHRVQRISPDSYPTSFCTPRDAQYVVEIAAGSIEMLNLQLDDVMSLK